MGSRTKRWLAVAAVGLCLFLVLSVWAVSRVVTWASDLPNRIVVQVEGESVRWFIAESARATLRQGDPVRQLECLEALDDGIKADPKIVPWVRAELVSEIDMLRKSPDPRVATLADEVHSRISSP